MTSTDQADRSARVRALRAQVGDLLSTLTARLAAGRPAFRARQRLRQAVRRLRRAEQAQQAGRKGRPCRRTP